MHIKTATIPAFVALALAGCDSAKSPAGAGADASSGTGTGRAEAVSRTTDMGSSKEKAITSETPVLPLLVRSVRGLTPDPDNAGQYMAGVCSLARGNMTTQQIKDSMAAQGADMAALPEPVRAIVNGSPEYHAAACAAYGVITASRPSSGWEVNPNSGAAMGYMAGELAAGLASAEVLAPIAQELAKQPGKSEAEYQELAAARFRELAPLWISTYDKELATQRQYVKDLTGRHAAPLHFTTSDGADFAADGGGAAIAYQGIDWYGRGYLKGTVYRVQVTQANSININRSKTGTTTRDTTTREETGANVSTQ